MIYHAGTGRTTFLAIIKVTTVFAVAFFCTTAASVMLDPDQPAWKPVACRSYSPVRAAPNAVEDVYETRNATQSAA